MDSSKKPEAESLEDDVNALEGPATEEVIDATSSDNSSKSSDSLPLEPPKQKGLKNTLKRFNIYLLFFLFILMIAGGIIAVAYFQSKKASTTSTLQTQTLTNETLKQVANSDANVGSNQQVLNVISSAVFAGKVLVRQDLEVAGNLQIGGTVGLSNLTVQGATQLGETTINKKLSVAEDTAIQGSVTIGKNLQITGSGTFSGPVSAPQITTSNLQLNSDLVLTNHIVIGGGTPARSNGPALGSGGSATVNGSDTAGTANINIGSGPSAGCFITISFTKRFNSTPRVQITPVEEGAGNLRYYVKRTSSNFSICSATAPTGGTSFAFDYFVVN
jgi:hypothetical protein